MCVSNRLRLQVLVCDSERDRERERDLDGAYFLYNWTACPAADRSKPLNSRATKKM